MTWVHYKPKARMRVLDRIFRGHPRADYFFGKNIVHLPTTKCQHLYDDDGAMKNAFGGLLNARGTTRIRGFTRRGGLLAIQKEIHTGVFAIMDGTTAGNGSGPREM